MTYNSVSSIRLHQNAEAKTGLKARLWGGMDCLGGGGVLTVTYLDGFIWENGYFLWVEGVSYL